MIKANFEVWKEIKEYEGLYQVSTWGRVRSLDRYVNSSHNNKQFIKGIILKPRKSKNGYLKVDLCKEGKQKYFLVHRLVAQTFLKNPNNYLVVNHKDEDKSNNRVDNLEWCTHKYNSNYGTRNERMIKTQTNNLKYSKKVYQYTLKGELVKIWPSVAECGRNGFNKGHIASCCRGKHKTHKGFYWSYTELN